MAIEMKESLFYSSLLSNKPGIDKLEKLYRNGVLSASEQLSLFFSRPLEISLTGFFFLPLSWLITNLEHNPSAELGVHSRVTGDIKGELYLCFSRDTAMKLVGMGLRKRRTIRKFFLSKLDESLLSEITNILINTFWNSIHENIPTRWWLTPPVSINSVLKSIKLASKIYSLDRHVLMAEFSVFQPEFKMQLILIPAGESFNTFLNRLNSN